MIPRTTDLEDAASLADVAPILRRAAEKYRESIPDLQAAWGDRFAGKDWERVARALESAANRCEKIAKDQL